MFITCQVSETNIKAIVTGVHHKLQREDTENQVRPPGFPVSLYYIIFFQHTKRRTPQMGVRLFVCYVNCDAAYFP